MHNFTGLKPFALMAALACAICIAPASAWSAPTIPTADDDTILVDKQPSQKIPYSKIVRAVIYKVFKFDSESLMTFGGNHRPDIARRFSDYLDRTKTKFKVKEDEVELEFKLHF